MFGLADQWRRGPVFKSILNSSHLFILLSLMVWVKIMNHSVTFAAFFDEFIHIIWRHIGFYRFIICIDAFLQLLNSCCKTIQFGTHVLNNHSILENFQKQCLYLPITIFFVCWKFQQNFVLISLFLLCKLNYKINLKMFIKI